MTDPGLRGTCFLNEHTLLCTCHINKLLCAFHKLEINMRYKSHLTLGINVVCHKITDVSDLNNFFYIAISATTYKKRPWTIEKSIVGIL